MCASIHALNVIAKRQRRVFLDQPGGKHFPDGVRKFQRDRLAVTEDAGVVIADQNQFLMAVCHPLRTNVAVSKATAIVP